jgi:hypothetical protein
MDQKFVHFLFLFFFDPGFPYVAHARLELETFLPQSPDYKCVPSCILEPKTKRDISQNNAYKWPGSI